MGTLQIGSPWILAALILNLALAIVVVLSGRRIPGRGNWLIGGGLIISIVMVLLAWVSRGELAFAPSEWARGWIWPREVTGSLRVGILSDPTGFTLTLLGILLAGLTVGLLPLLGSRPKIERSYAAAGVAALGFSLTWISATVWIGLVGLALTALGGILTFGADWEDEAEARIAGRYVRERACAMLLSLIGAAALAGRGIDVAWEPASNIIASEDTLGLIGTLLLLTGLLLQLQPAPFSGWTLMQDERTPSMRIVIAQVFPGLAAFSLFFRLHRHLEGLGALEIVGWVALAASALSTISGLLQTQWRRTLSCWCSAAFCLSIAAGSFAGAWSGLAIALSAALATVTSSTLGTALDTRASDASAGPTPTAPSRVGWARAGAFAAALSGAGVIGFVSSGGMVRWLGTALAHPAMITLSGTALFLFALLAWRIAVLIARLPGTTQVGWAVIVLAWLPVLLSLGCLWTGSLSAGSLPGNPDLLFAGVLEKEFLQDAALVTHPVAGTALGILAGILVASATAAFAFLRSGRDLAKSAQRAAPRLTWVITESYGIDRLLNPIAGATARLGSLLQQGVDRNVWDRWLPSALRVAGAAISDTASRGDQALIGAINTGARRAVDVPAQVLQLIQSGDVQWYLIFAIGSGIAILLHFLRF